MTTLPTLKAFNSPYMQYYFKRFFALQKATEIEIAFFHSFGNPKYRTLNHFFYASHALYFHIYIIWTTLEYTECDEVPGILFSAHSIDHTFIPVVLEKFGFRPDFINSFKTFFTRTESCVMNNGHSTRYFHLKERLDKEIQYLPTCLSLLWKFCSLGFVRMSK